MSTFRLAALALALPLVSSAAAAQTTWKFDDATAPGSCSVSGGNGSGYGNQMNCSAQPSGTTTSLRVTAFSLSGSLSSSTVSASAITGPWSGSGVGVGNSQEGGTGAQSPNHAMDNAGWTGYTDVLLLDFLTGGYDLNSVSLGWVDGDSDFQVLRYAGVGAPTMVGQSVSQLFANGWQLNSSVNGGSAANSYNVNAANASSQYWMIAAYNTALGTAQGLSAGNDQFKVQSINATSVPGGGTGSVVPEPSTYVLMGTGLLGLAGFARRRRTNV